MDSIARSDSPIMDTQRHREVLARLSATIARANQRFDSHFLESPTVGVLFEQITRSIYETLLSPGDAAIDVGANHGMHTFPMAQAVGPTGLVIAFEPIPTVAEALRQRVATECAGVVDVQQLALSNRTGIADFHCVEANHGYSGLQAKNYPFEPLTKLIKVQVDRLDHRLGALASRSVRFIKLDIEGGEFDALRGGEDLLRRHRPLVVFENSKRAAAESYGYSKSDFFEFFASLGYELRDILGCPLLPDHWNSFGPWYSLACPREHAGFVAVVQAACVAERILGLPW